jgi:hypothetical protein
MGGIPARAYKDIYVFDTQTKRRMREKRKSKLGGLLFLGKHYRCISVMAACHQHYVNVYWTFFYWTIWKNLPRAKPKISL